jgi:uncharacterized protein
MAESNVVPFSQFRHFNAMVGDTWKNLVSMLGTWKDKAIAQEPDLTLLNAMQLEKLYRGEWVCRKIVDLPAFDTCRAWRQWQAEEDQIEALEEAERAFGLQRKLMSAISRARLFGGSVLILGVDGTGDWGDELDLDDVKKGALKFVHVVTGGRHPYISAGPRVRDVTNPWFGEPSYYKI